MLPVALNRTLRVPRLFGLQRKVGGWKTVQRDALEVEGRVGHIQFPSLE